MNVAVTGTIGSGKSLVSKRLGEMFSGVVIDADSICHELMQMGCAGYDKFNQLTDNKFLMSSGELDRQALKKAIVDYPEVKATLEQVLHPMVHAEFKRIFSQEHEWAFFEVPLLFEAGLEGEFDCVVTVFADTTTAINRVAIRDNITEAFAKSVMGLQMSPEQKKELADFVIDNSGTEAELELQLEKTCDFLQLKAASLKNSLKRIMKKS